MDSEQAKRDYKHGVKMEFKYIITDEDIKKVVEFVKEQDNTFVKGRIKKNVSEQPLKLDKNEFWDWLVSCLLTTQQRSGPNSHITKFISLKPFPLSYEVCKKSDNIESTAYKILSSFGGIRMTTKISEQIKTNFEMLETGMWTEVLELGEKLIKSRNKPEQKAIEREACIFVQKLNGVGPKQSRNLWQALGMTRYEIPIDSRIIKWLNKNGFPFKLSPIGLQDEYYYELILDGLQELCQKANVYPCVLDGAIFSSYDEEWPEENTVW